MSAFHDHERRIVHFAGHVQGVGFRYTTRNIARGYPVTGYVRNLADGRVQLVVEGPPKAIDGMVDEIADKLGTYIREKAVDRQEANGEFPSFEIRH